MAKKETLASVLVDACRKYFEKEGRIEPHSGKYRMRSSDAEPLSKSMVIAVEEYILKRLRENSKYRFSDERDNIMATSKMSLQKKQKRLVINLPEWLKGKLEEKAEQNGVSMNEIIRTALVDYLAED